MNARRILKVRKANFINSTGDFATIEAAQEYASTGGIPTTSVTSGGVITKMRIKHLWVEAARLDYHPSRGVPKTTSPTAGSNSTPATSSTPTSKGQAPSPSPASTNPTVGDVIGGRKTIIQEYPVLPSALPNKIITTSARYGELPNTLRYQMSLAFSKEILGDLNDPATYPWAALNNHKITLSFKPATADDEAALQSLLPDGDITDISQLVWSCGSHDLV